MTRRQVQRDLDKVSQELLEGLDTAERLQAYLQVQAGEHPDQTQKLDRAAPREDKSIRDPKYVKERIATREMAQRARADLHIALLRYRWRQAAWAAQVQAGNVAALKNGPPEQNLLAQLALERERWAEFAEDELNCSIRELLASTHRGDAVLDEVDRTLVDRHAKLVDERSMKFLRDLVEIDDISPPSTEDIAESGDPLATSGGDE